MEPAFLDIYEAFSSAGDEYQIFERITSCAKKLGFEYCCYGIRTPIPVSNPSIAIFETYPEGWMKHYQESNYLGIDPTVKTGARHSRLMVWSELIAAETRPFWADAHDFGLRVGVAQSNWSANGVFGLLTMSRHADTLSRTEINRLPQPINWLANLSHVTMSNFLLPKLIPESQVQLTAREREVLCWSGEGKTAYEVGKILGISERTVNFHIGNLLSKLEATNKIQAAVKASAMGLIQLG